jgi:hypothetical protein
MINTFKATMHIVIIAAVISTLTPPFCNGAQTMPERYLDGNRLKYYGYFYKNDVLKNKKELKEIREFANMLVFSLIQFDTVTPEMVNQIMEGNLEKFDSKIFDDMAKRIDILESMDYVTVGEMSFYPLIRFDKFEEFKKTLRFLKKRVPQMSKLDYIYFWDEPDLNYIPGPEIIEKYIVEFKKVFPKVKVTACYAIAKERFLKTVPSKSYDLLMIDPYFSNNESRKHSAADFEKFYRSRLALGLAWANKWDKPFLMVGDSFGSTIKEGKLFPAPDISLWYYIIALTQPKCIGLIWFQYGYLETAENITGVELNGKFTDVIKVHREIGKTIFDKPSPLGVPFKIGEPAIPEVVKKALGL